MPAFLLSPTFWKIAGVALLALALTVSVGLFVHHYEDLKTQAALVGPLRSANDALVKQAARDDSRASKAAIDLVAAEAARTQALADLDKFRSLYGQVGTTLQGISRNANATKNPVCLPTDVERSLFNGAVARFLNGDAGTGQAGAHGEVPGGAH